jgi:hypothetical protein
MAAPNPAFRIADGELLPFNPVPDAPNVEEAFRVEISLLSARFKIQNSAAAASDSSPTAAMSSAPIGAAAGATGAGDAVAAASPAPKKPEKPVEFYALPELPDFPKCTFKGPVKDRPAASAITVSSDPATEDKVTWVADACVATFENKKFKLVHQDDGPRKWQQENLDIRLIQAKANKECPPNFLKDQATKRDGAFIPLSKAVINLADFVSTAEPAAECVRQVTYASHPSVATKYSLTLQVKTTPSKRPPAARVPKSPEQIASTASSNLGNAQSGNELLLFKLAPHCSFTSGTHVGIAEEEAWRGKGVMLLHTLSALQACQPSAPNYLGQVMSAHAAAGYVAIRVKCPEILKTKNGKTIVESRFGWRLLPACSSALKQSIDMQRAPYASFDLQNEPIFCIFPSSDAAEADGKVAQQEPTASAQRSLQLEDGLRIVTEMKQRALQGMDAAVQLTQDELGAVLLRDGFLASQPLVSDCVRALIAKWYPGTYEDECVRAFRSRDGPWDMFYVFDYLRKRNLRSDRSSSSSFSKLLEELGYVGAADVAYGDRQQRLLEELMDRCSRRLRRSVWRHSNRFFAD